MGRKAWTDKDSARLNQTFRIGGNELRTESTWGPRQDDKRAGRSSRNEMTRIPLSRLAKD